MAAQHENYYIRLPQFEGPFDLLLFFIERDELDIYNIPITRITNDFLAYINAQEKLNIELSSEFILFISTLMRIKAKMLIPRKELDAQGNEIDPRQELVDKILEYKKFKEASAELALLETERLKMARRGNVVRELSTVGETSGEGTEIQSISLYKLMQVYERVMLRLVASQQKPVHTVVRYNYTMEGSRHHVLEVVRQKENLAFEDLFADCENRIHAIFLFLSMLELAQQRFMTLLIGEGRNNFMIQWNARRDEELAEAKAAGEVDLLLDANEENAPLPAQ